MDRAELLDTIQRESTALLAVTRAIDPSRPVPGCPAWTVADLVWHVGEIDDFWAYVVRERSTSADGYEHPARPGTGDSPSDAFELLHTFVSERAAELHRVLSAADPATPVWTWARQQDVAFVIRRAAHETAVHRFDAEAAAGREHRIDGELAADGIDEFFEFFLPKAAPDRPPLMGSVHLHCSDVGGEWTIRSGESGDLVVTRDHTKADAALRGEAHDLLMVLWRRAPLDAVTVFGDRGLAEAFIARTSNG